LKGEKRREGIYQERKGGERQHFCPGFHSLIPGKGGGMGVQGRGRGERRFQTIEGRRGKTLNKTTACHFKNLEKARGKGWGSRKEKKGKRGQIEK